MTAVKRNFFEFFILIGSICYLVVLFTPGWIIYDGGNIGVITFDSTEIGWFAASSCMIYFSFVLLLLVSSFSTILFRDVKKSGYSYKQRPQFVFLSMISLMVTASTVIAVILTGVNLQTVNNIIGIDATAEIGWFAASSCLMYFACVLFLLVTTFSTMLFRDVKKSGYSYDQRPKFLFLSLLSLLVTTSTVIALILTGVNLSTFNNIIGIDATLGYSAWISVGCALIYFINAGLALSIAFLDCR